MIKYFLQHQDEQKQKEGKCRAHAEYEPRGLSLSCSFRFLQRVSLFLRDILATHSLLCKKANPWTHFHSLI